MKDTGVETELSIRYGKVTLGNNNERKCFITNEDPTKTPVVTEKNPLDYITCDFTSNIEITVGCFDNFAPENTREYSSWIRANPNATTIITIKRVMQRYDYINTYQYVLF